MAVRVVTWKWDDAGQPKYPEEFEILKKAVLQVTDIKTNRNKYYAIELHHAKAIKKGQAFRVFTHYGRTDDLENNPDSGQKECRYLDSKPEAEAVYDQIYKEKTSARKGYREVALASSKIGSQKARGSSSGEVDEKTLQRIEVNEVEKPAEPKVSLPRLEETVRGLVRYLYDEAVGALTSRVQAKVTAHGIETPLGVLTIGQIEQGESILGDIYKQLQKKKQTPKVAETLRDLSSAFYTVIPHRFGRSREAAEAAIIRDLNNYQTKQETLQLMKDMLRVNGESGLFACGLCDLCGDGGGDPALSDLHTYHERIRPRHQRNRQCCVGLRCGVSSHPHPQRQTPRRSDPFGGHPRAWCANWASSRGYLRTADVERIRTLSPPPASKLPSDAKSAGAHAQRDEKTSRLSRTTRCV